MFRSRRADDREKCYEKSRRLAARGDVRKAISVLRGFAAANPEDERTLIKLADLHRRCGDDAEAVGALSCAAELYSRRGFDLKAAAALRQAAAIVPNDLALLERLGETNAQLGMAREAAICLNQVTQAIALTGDRLRLLTLRRRILELLPGDAGAVIRLVDVLADFGDRDEAIRLLEQAADARREPAQVELWILLQERLADLQPGNFPCAKELARALLQRGESRRALARLKPCVAAGHRDVDTLSLLAQAFEALGLVGKAGAAWREIAHAHQRAGRVTELCDAWERVLRLLPDDAEAAAALAPPTPTPPPPVGALEDELAEADFFSDQGLVADARALLLLLRERFPGAATVVERLEALDAKTLDAIELLEEDVELVLFEEVPRDSTTAILDRVPIDRAVRIAESATHRDLAVAFIEMERFDDALAELEKAIAGDPFSEGACLALAGRCHLARGVPKDAADAYRRALASTTLSYEAATAVHYELAEALAEIGARTDSLAHFGEAARLEPGYRDVSARIAALSPPS
jgi:tetratricopeptide (TPR) repeat protein